MVFRVPMLLLLLFGKTHQVIFLLLDVREDAPVVHRLLLGGFVALVVIEVVRAVERNTHFLEDAYDDFPLLII